MNLPPIQGKKLHIARVAWIESSFMLIVFTQKILISERAETTKSLILKNKNIFPDVCVEKLFELIILAWLHSNLYIVFVPAISSQIIVLAIK